MKTSKLLTPFFPVAAGAAVLLALFFNGCACNFNQSVEKDLATGAYSRGDGITCGDMVIQASGQTGKENRFVYGETVQLLFNDVTGFQKEDNRVFPGLSLFIINNEKDIPYWLIPICLII